MSALDRPAALPHATEIVHSTAMARRLGMMAAAALALSTMPAPLPAMAQANDAAQLEALRGADLRLATIGYRLSAAAAPLCDRLEPGTGIQFHTLAQYAPATRGEIARHFRFATNVAVEGVAPDSPAARAGVRQDDSIAAINDVPVEAQPPGDATTAALAALHSRFAALPPTAPLHLTLNRAGRELRVRVDPVPACFTRYELRIADNFDARANGELVQLTSRYLEQVPPELLPAVIAHELSHNILRHRERLAAAGATFGMASGFGRNVGLFRQTEIEADILAVHLLARAGYDPGIAARFWRDVGPRLLAGMIRSRSHPAMRDRVAIAQAEAARIAGQADAPLPTFYTERAQPLTGNWQRYLPGG